ncbi:exo-alpha-sialidase [Ramlibacter sp. G-1-2-2]|uniref:Exo-alpha-sialidase n=1 Tax=Ramlibacter agri TaxID=2728837 RepID=A0A848HAA2_9BURK|nr:sialidase family protein [Ramlibacter agri]NML46361.1 exo-alpha-sialidase [Ramlibacter agri]
MGSARVVTPTISGVPAACASSVRFAIESGSLPPGISMDPASGVLSGTLTKAGSYLFQARMRVEGTSYSYASGLMPIVTDPAAFSFSGWELMTTTAPFLQDFRVGGIGHTVYVITRGYNSHTVETWASTNGGAGWTLVPGAGPTGDLRRFALASDGVGIYLSGGTDATGAASPAVWYFDGTTWTQRTAAAPFPGRESHEMLWSNGALYVLGGRLGMTWYDDTWRSTDGGVTWTLASAHGFENRYDFCAVADASGAMIVTGGHNVSVDRISVYRSTDGTSWTRLPVDENSPLRTANQTQSGACALLNGRIVFAGDGPALTGASNTVSSSDGITWSYEPHKIDLMTLTAGGVVVDGRMYVTAGSGTSQRKVVRTIP